MVVLAIISKFFQTLTPLHVGAGEGNSYVDMPIQREVATQIPKVESSTVKGTFRSLYEKNTSDETDKTVNQLFGSSDESGRISFSDLKLLAFPVKCSEKVIAYITSYYVLDRLYREIEHRVEMIDIKEDVKEILKDVNPTPREDCVYTISEYGKRLTLGDYMYSNQKIECHCKSHLFKALKERLVIVPDDSFIDFVTYYTEVVTRIRINQETKTVKDQGLFTVEYLPSESILYGHMGYFEQKYFGEDKEKVNEKDLWNTFEIWLDKINTLQLGGHETLGKGLVTLLKEGDEA